MYSTCKIFIEGTHGIEPRLLLVPQTKATLQIHATALQMIQHLQHRRIVNIDAATSSGNEFALRFERPWGMPFIGADMLIKKHHCNCYELSPIVVLPDDAVLTLYCWRLSTFQ